MIGPAPGEEIRMSRTTVGPDVMTVAIWRPNETDKGRHLAGASSGAAVENEPPGAWAERLYRSAIRTANNDNR